MKPTVCVEAQQERSAFGVPHAHTGNNVGTSGFMMEM